MLVLPFLLCFCFEKYCVTSISSHEKTIKLFIKFIYGKREEEENKMCVYIQQCGTCMVCLPLSCLFIVIIIFRSRGTFTQLENNYMDNFFLNQTYTDTHFHIQKSLCMLIILCFSMHANGKLCLICGTNERESCDGRLYIRNHKNCKV